jgi:hypothetical protein
VRPALAACAVVLLGLAAGCGSAEDGDGAAQPPAPGYLGTGVGRTVEEALRAGGRQTVRGTLLARDGETRLCSAILESFPPQCGQPSLLVVGLDPAAVDGTTTAEGVTWSEREVTLHGTVDGDVLRVGEEG